jgi:hypothetical protein
MTSTSTAFLVFEIVVAITTVVFVAVGYCFILRMSVTNESNDDNLNYCTTNTQIGRSSSIKKKQQQEKDPEPLDVQKKDPAPKPSEEIPILVNPNEADSPRPTLTSEFRLSSQGVKYDDGTTAFEAIDHACTYMDLYHSKYL